MRLLFVCLLYLATTFATPLWAVEIYDLIFKRGTLSDVSMESALVYDRKVDVHDKTEISERNVGKVKLTFEPGNMARLTFYQGEKYRSIGSYPATVGNPIIMYFVETVIRDVSQKAGGSPFYIRNRVKASLLQDVPIENATLRFNGKDVPARQITLRPFLNDKNRSKMRGFEDLALTITMSAKIPGWYYSLVADTKRTDGISPVYSYALTLSPEGLVR